MAQPKQSQACSTGLRSIDPKGQFTWQITSSSIKISTQQIWALFCFILLYINVISRSKHYFAPNQLISFFCRRIDSVFTFSLDERSTKILQSDESWLITLSLFLFLLWSGSMSSVRLQPDSPDRCSKKDTQDWTSDVTDWIMKSIQGCLGCYSPWIEVYGRKCEVTQRHIVDVIVIVKKRFTAGWVNSRAFALRPIEHVSDGLGRATAKRNSPYRIGQEIKAALFYKWFLMPQTFIKKLINNMTARCGTYTAMNGVRIPY